MKYLIWLLIGFAVVTWFSRLKSRVSNNMRNGRDGQGRKQEPAIESMQQCVHCGTYIPSSESMVDAGGKIYCSKEHLALHREQRR